MSFPDIVEIDLPTIIVMIVLWLVGFLKDRKTDRGHDRPANVAR